MDFRLHGERTWERPLFWTLAVIFVLYFGAHFTIAIFNDSFKHPQSLERTHRYGH